MTTKEYAVADRLTDRGCLTRVPYAFGWLIVVTPRGRLALQCYAAVQSVLV